MPTLSELVAQVQSGQTSLNDLRAALGRPTTTADESAWLASPGALASRISAIYQNAGQALTPPVDSTLGSVDDLANRVASGQLTLNDIRASVGRPLVSVDERNHLATPEAIRARISAIYGNSGVPIQATSNFEDDPYLASLRASQADVERQIQRTLEEIDRQRQAAQQQAAQIQGASQAVYAQGRQRMQDDVAQILELAGEQLGGIPGLQDELAAPTLLAMSNMQDSFGRAGGLVGQGFDEQATQRRGSAEMIGQQLVSDIQQRYNAQLSQLQQSARQRQFDAQAAARQRGIQSSGLDQSQQQFNEQIWHQAAQAEADRRFQAEQAALDRRTQEDIARWNAAVLSQAMAPLPALPPLPPVMTSDDKGFAPAAPPAPAPTARRPGGSTRISF